MSAKKKGSVVILILSIISLVIGTIWTMTSLTVAITNSSVPTWRILILLFFSFVFILLGVLGLIFRPREKKEGKKKLNVGLIIGIAVLIIFGLVQVVNVLSVFGRRGILNSTLGKYVKADYTEEDVKMPEDPWFVFYNKDDGNFEFPMSSYTRGTDDPKKVNVVVMYKDETFRDGTWVTGTGEEVGASLMQRTHVYIIRLEDWSLIDDHSFKFELDYGEKSVDSTRRDEVITYINDTLK